MYAINAIGPADEPCGTELLCAEADEVFGAADEVFGFVNVCVESSTPYIFLPSRRSDIDFYNLL